MERQHTFCEFENINLISKTLRFNLIPQGETLSTIQTKGLIENDRIRNRDYIHIKAAADSFYRHIIKQKLSCLDLDWTELANATNAWLENKVAPNAMTNINVESKWRAAQGNYRQTILEVVQGKRDSLGVECDKETAKENASIFDGYFKEELISKHLPTFLEQKLLTAEPEEKETIQKQQEALKSYKGFTSRLTTFWNNRKNIFTADDISTSLTYRIVNDNFLTFLSNIDIFQEHQKKHFFEHLEEAYQYLETELRNQHILRGNQKITDFFNVNGFNLLCTQAGIEQYRAILGGFVKENGEKVKGLNELLNLYQQKLNKAQQEAGKKVRIKQLTKLNKQILEETSSSSFVIDQIENDRDLLNRLVTFHNLMQAPFDFDTSIVEAIDKLPKQLKSANPDEIWVDVKFLAQISYRLSGQWQALQQGLLLMAETDSEQSKGSQNERLQRFQKAAREGQELGSFRTPLYFNFSELESALQVSEVKEADIQEISIYDFWLNDSSNLEVKTTEIFKLVHKLKDEQTSLLGNRKAIEQIKSYLDAWQNEFSRWRILNVDTKNFDGNIDNAFYPSLHGLMESLTLISSLYNLTRNYLTKKPSHKNKFRLNFDNPTLANGWSESKISSNRCALLRKNGLYYLAILQGESVARTLLEHQATQKEYYERLVYTYFPGASKMIPKCAFTRAVKQHFHDGHTQDFMLDRNFTSPLCIKKDLFDLQFNLVNGKKRYQVDYFRQTGDEQGFRNALKKWICFCQDFLARYQGTSTFDFSSLKAPEYYTDLTDFYQDVDACCYKVEFTRVDAEWFDSLVENGGVLLFQLHNKDFSPDSKGKPNLHTLYWHSLFSPENLENNYIKLNGMATLFYREAQVKDISAHKKGSVLLNRYTSKGEPISREYYQELYQYYNGKRRKSELSAGSLEYLNSGLLVSKKANYDIVKNKRYTTDHFFLHIPLSFNWKKNAGHKVNDLAKRSVLENRNQYVIGIDRGERHLLYYSVVDGNGRIVEQGSLNETIHTLPDSSQKHVPYHSLLKHREEERKEARVKWQSIDQIKNLKEGYLSHIIHRLSELILKYEAFVILEDLNVGFKRGRFKVERQVYQKFEMALMNKLSALALKDKAIDALGGVLRPLQLCNPVLTYQDLKGQNGILFYVMSSYTSVVDPTTGFANLFNLNRINNHNREDFFSRFDKLNYDKNTNSFIFKFNYNQFGQYSRIPNLPPKIWEVSTQGERIVFQSKNREYQTCCPTDIIRTVIEQYSLDYQNGRDLLKPILGLDHIGKENILRKLFNALSLTLRLRNSNQDVDYILSPVRNNTGAFFDTRKAEPYLPQNADANGAYLIARKGQLTFEFMRQAYNAGTKSSKVTNSDWFTALYQL